MKTKLVIVAMLLASGCTVRLEEGDARAFNDDLLYAKIRRHQAYLAENESERREHNLNLMVMEMQNRYPGWDPDSSAFPYRAEEARASLRSDIAPASECSEVRFTKLRSLGLSDEQIIRICGSTAGN